LREVIPFGQNLFRQNLGPFIHGSMRLIFTGDRATQLAAC
jgi:hypothetical protein